MWKYGVADRNLEKSELSRLTMAVNSLVEENPQSWRSNGDEFYDGVLQGMRTTSKRLSMIADSSEQRVSTCM